MSSPRSARYIPGGVGGAGDVTHGGGTVGVVAGAAAGWGPYASGTPMGDGKPAYMDPSSVVFWRYVIVGGALLYILGCHVTFRNITI
jgi:hypothetical protein